MLRAMLPHERCFRLTSRAHPRYAVLRLAGEQVREKASRFFSGRMLDRVALRAENFTCMYLVVARKPARS